MVLSSLKLNKDVLALPLKFLPPVWNFKSYYNVFTTRDYDFPRYFLNSFIVVIGATLLCVFFSTTAGYGFAKYKFKGNNVLFLVILSTMMIPLQAIIIPLFILVKKMGIGNSYLGLILPESVSAFCIFLMRQFMDSIPNEIIESARIDGASEFRIFFSIIIPMSRMAIIALIIFHAQWVWNLLVWPLIVITSSEMRTVPQGIALYSGVYFTPYPEQLAAGVSAIAPILILYIFLSRYFQVGINLSGLKE
jgi:ABC-type glycerol-3-phosphate transport system permease component